MHPESSSSTNRAVAEIQGLYGPFSFPEKLLQKIWMRGDFDARHAVTKGGEKVQILRPGKWNLLGGPDFKGACIRVGATLMTGDIEVHLHAGDWGTHGHARDPAYADVVLHVVLFADGEAVTSGFEGRPIPVLAMLPLLRHDLEEYAADDAVERLAHHPLAQVEEKLLALPHAELQAEMFRQAKLRWERKVHFASVRIQRLGWAAACHETALEILGYRFNRAVMLSLAAEFPLEAWSSEEGEAWVERVSLAGQSRWKVQGVRPANHPRTRIRQYASWVSQERSWPARLDGSLPELLAALPASDSSRTTADWRRSARFPRLREQIFSEVCGRTVSGTRLDTLVCDGFLPLLAARASEDQKNSLSEVWYHWFVGDLPARFASLLKALGLVDGRRDPACHGLSQGLLGWLLTHEERQSRSGERS